MQNSSLVLSNKSCTQSCVEVVPTQRWRNEIAGDCVASTGDGNATELRAWSIPGPNTELFPQKLYQLYITY